MDPSALSSFNFIHVHTYTNIANRARQTEMRINYSDTLSVLVGFLQDEVDSENNIYCEQKSTSLMNESVQKGNI